MKAGEYEKSCGVDAGCIKTSQDFSIFGIASDKSNAFYRNKFIIRIQRNNHGCHA